MSRFAVLLYPSASLQEITCLTAALSVWYGESIDYIAGEDKEYRSEEGLRLLPTKTAAEADPAGYDCVILPGTIDPLPALHDEALVAFLRRGIGTNTVFAAISSAPLLLCRAGLLKGKKFTAGFFMQMVDVFPFVEKKNFVHKGVVTDANARLCRQFITANSKAFRQAEQRYGVPSSIAASLLFVETRLGKVLGDTSENAFYTLASMAVSRTPESISDWLPQLRDHERHMDWIAETMPKRADWAYKETRALVEHMLRDRVPPEHLPGSIYGAVGLCQFMPSNIATYGADGDGDGRVDLFTVPDAVASLSHYLARHGWKAGLSRERQHALLMRYNHSTVYANTIMALADRVAALK